MIEYCLCPTVRDSLPRAWIEQLKGQEERARLGIGEQVFGEVVADYSMPDYNPHPTSQAGMRRPLRYQDGETSDRPGDLRVDLEPAPKPWPGMPYLAVLLVFGFLALQLYPATHWRHPNDKTRTWIKHLKPGEKPEIIQATGRDAFYSTLDEVRGQQAEDLAAQEGVVQVWEFFATCFCFQDKNLNGKFLL